MNNDCTDRRRRMRFGVALALIVALAAFAVGAAPAAAHPALYGARALGMGGAYTAVVDDATALYWNPGALGASPLTVNAAYGVHGDADISALNDIGDDPEALLDLETKGAKGVGLLLGASLGSIGAGYLVDGDVLIEKDGGDAFDGKAEMHSSIGVGVSRDIVGDGRDGVFGVRAGAVIRSVSAMRSDYTVDASSNITESKQSGQGYAVDLGALIRVSEVFTAGATVHNVLGETTWEDSGKETPEIEFRIGAALTPPLLGGTIAVDVASGGEFRYGIEKKLLLGGMRVRVGQIHNDDNSWTTGGLGFALGSVAIDLAVITEDFKEIGYAVEAGFSF